MQMRRSKLFNNNNTVTLLFQIVRIKRLLFKKKKQTYY